MRNFITILYQTEHECVIFCPYFWQILAEKGYVFDKFHKRKHVIFFKFCEITVKGSDVTLAHMHI